MYHIIQMSSLIVLLSVLAFVCSSHEQILYNYINITRCVCEWCVCVLYMCVCVCVYVCARDVCEWVCVSGVCVRVCVGVCTGV
jgi:hypothetical protein